MPDTEDGKVTLAIIQQDIKYLSKQIADFLEKAKERDGRITGLETRINNIEPTVKTIAKVFEIALYVVVIAAIGGIVWAAVQSGSVIP